MADLLEGNSQGLPRWEEQPTPVTIIEEVTIINFSSVIIFIIAQLQKVNLVEIIIPLNMLL